MKKVDAKQVMMCVVLIGALLFVGVYFWVYKTYTDKTEAMRRENKTLVQRVNELEQYYHDMDNNKEEIAAMQAQVMAWLENLPVDVKEEDIIVMAIDTEKTAIINYTNINIEARKEMLTIPSATVAGAEMENLSGDLMFVQRKASYVNETEYFSLKDCIETINDSANRLAISNINYSENEDTGLLEGTIDITYYSVIGTNREYIPQKLPPYESGLWNLFGMPEIPVEEETGEEPAVE